MYCVSILQILQGKRLIMTVYYIYTYIIINLNLNVPSKLILFEEYLEILLGIKGNNKKLKYF